MHRCVLVALAIGLVLAASAAADDVYDVTESETSTTTFGDYVGGDARQAYVHVSGAGTIWTVDSGWDNGFSGAKSFWTIADGARILVTAAAAINNNMDDLIHARDFGIAGANTGEVFEPAADWNADLGSAAAPTGGLSTLTVQNATLLTHATQSLPSIWKYVDSNLSHHGLLNFTTGPNAVWKVRTQDQSYDGGIYWKYDWTLDVAAGLDLEFLDTAPERALGADVGFGPYGADGTTLTKTGGGTLTLNGAMGWQPDSTLRVSAGGVLFGGYDPGDGFTSGYMGGSGPYLTLDVEAAGAAALAHPNASDHWTVEAIACDGTLEVGPGQVAATEDLACAATALVALQVSAADAGRTKIDVGGTLTEAGTLRVDNAGGLGLGSYTLFGAASFGGPGFALDLPTGYAGSYGGGVLQITGVPEPATVALVAMGLALALRRRRRH